MPAARPRSGPEPERGPAAEAKELLLGCLRFAARYPDGGLKLGVPPVPYDPEVDDRDPIGFQPPPDLPHSPGWNQVWNTIVTLDDADVRCEGAVLDRDAAVAALRAIVDAGSATNLILAVIAATRLIDKWDQE